jgi:hypothetical protein
MSDTVDGECLERFVLMCTGGTLSMADVDEYAREPREMQYAWSDIMERTDADDGIALVIGALEAVRGYYAQRLRFAACARIDAALRYVRANGALLERRVHVLRAYSVFAP